jgi:hypothetical protein
VASSAWVLGATAGPATFKGPWGFWGELSFGRDVPLSAALEFRGSLGFSVTSYADSDEMEFHDWSVIETTEDESLGLAGLGRGSLGYHFGKGWLGRVGVALGYAHIIFDSTQCGSHTMGNVFWGLSAGPAYRFGGVELGLSAEFFAYPLVRCTNSGPESEPSDEPAPYVHERRELNPDDPTLVLALALSYRLP